MDNIVEKLQSLLYMNLVNESFVPVLSGNMKAHIEQKTIGEIVISAPFYDMAEWNKNHRIVHTGKQVKGKTDYALWVNDNGAFGSNNSSKGWVNRAILDAVNAISKEIDAEVIYEL